MKRSPLIPSGLAAASILLLSACSTKAEPKPADPPPVTSPFATKEPDRTLAEAAIKKLHAALKEKNPDYADTGNADVTEDGEIIVLVLRDAKVADLSPLQGLKLRAIDLFNTPVSDISALKGMPLEGVYLEGTQVKDLSPLKGAPIRALYLSRTPVEDLTPLEGMPIASLNLLGTRVSDIRVLATLPLNTLWLNSTPVSDIAPLAGCRRLVSLTLYGTHVTDLRPIADLAQLQRLHIGNTNITDLRPLQRMNLSRLIFTPSKITHGIDVVREMPSIFQIDTKMDMEGNDRLMSPREFWQRYDNGEFK